MKVRIDVRDRQEAEAVQRVMNDPAGRAFVLIVGYLEPLAPRARLRVLNWAIDAFDMQHNGGEPSIAMTAFGETALRLHDGSSEAGTSTGE